jgi:hypothetical protein
MWRGLNVFSLISFLDGEHFWMADALDPAAHIYAGIWTDWTRGKVWGLTLTLCPDHAVLVTSALAVFVTLSGSQLWTITRFTLHQTKNTPGPDVRSPTIHNKQQLILRNAPTDLATARLMAELAWTSRKQKRSGRTILIAIFALLHAALFIAAGTFSNRIISAGSTTDGSRVLSISKHCGVWNQTYFDIAANGNNPESNETLQLSTQFISKTGLEIQLSLQYAQECYLKDTNADFMSAACNTMKTPKLNWTTHQDDCPFDTNVCHTAADALVMETAVIDSHKDLGINAKPNDRITYQRRTTCAVLNDTDHVKGWDGEVDQGLLGTSRETAFAFYGPVLYKDVNFTYSYSNFASLYDNFTNTVTIPYQVGSEMAWAVADPQWSVSDFEPTPEVAQDSADLILFFLSYTGKYLNPIDDPWFSAHRSHRSDTLPPLMETLYSRDSAISTLGCTEQHQFCTADKVCTGWAGFDQVQNVGAFNDALTANQNATWDRVLRAVAFTTLGRVVESLSLTSTPLQAVKAAAAGTSVVSLDLPDVQWKIELDAWHAIAMAAFQRAIVQWGTGEIAAEPQFLNPPESDQDKWFCHSLMIPSTVYSSFSMMAIILIVIFGTLVIVISLNVERIAHAIRKCLGRAKPKKAWDHDDMLKLSTRIRDSIFRPKPPPKDSEHLPSVPTETPTICVSSPSTRRDASAKSVYTMDDDGCRRSSSPTLPLDDRLTTIGSKSLQSQSLEVPGHEQGHRYDRDSWMAISLNDGNDGEGPSPTRAPLSRPAAQHINPNIVANTHRQSSIVRNFDVRGPRKYHLPLTNTSWV